MARSETPPDPTTRLLRDRVQRVFRHLPKALAGDEEEIHQMRVAARRLRVALPLLARKPGGKRARRAGRILRDMTRAGGGSRDLDVGVSLFDASVTHPKTPELRSLRRTLRAARQRSYRRMTDGLLDLDIARLRRVLKELLSRRAEGLFTVLVRLREATDAERKGLEDAMDEVADRCEPARLHRVRIRARRLRYQAEVLDALRGQESGAPAMFRELQEVLGHLHDAWVLAEWLSRQAERARAAGALARAEEAERLASLFVTKSHEQHAAFLALDPKALVARAFAAMLPSRTAA